MKQFGIEQLLATSWDSSDSLEDTLHHRKCSVLSTERQQNQIFFLWVAHSLTLLMNHVFCCVERCGLTMCMWIHMIYDILWTVLYSRSVHSLVYVQSVSLYLTSWNNRVDPSQTCWDEVSRWIWTFWEITPLHHVYWYKKENSHLDYFVAIACRFKYWSLWNGNNLSL